MALTEIPIELSSTPSIVDNGNATAITIGSDESVALGGTLSLPNANATNEISFTGTEFTNVLSATTSGFQLGTTGAGYLSFLTNNTERSRLTASGDLFVGQTAGSSTTVGHILQANGKAFHIAAGNNPLHLTRLTSDGDIQQFYKDSTHVGSIGTNAATMYVSAPQAGGMKYSYHNSTNAVMLPVTTTGASADGTHDLGLAGGRFKDIYLSGGAFLGGTAAANKLSDVETGTWTPVIKAIGAGGNAATATMAAPTYTKVGRLVNVSVYISGININTITAGTYITLQGLPFTATNYADFTIAYKSGDWSTSGNIIGGYVQSGDSYAYFMRANGLEALQTSTDVTMTKAMINITYQAS